MRIAYSRKASTALDVSVQSEQMCFKKLRWCTVVCTNWQFIYLVVMYMC